MDKKLPLIPSGSGGELSTARNIPEIILTAGHGARFAWEEMFIGQIRNKDTRRAYHRAASKFLEWCSARNLQLTTISPADVGLYLDSLRESHHVTSQKQIMAALRKLFDFLVVRHAIALNPAASVRTEKYQVIEGKTPEITVKQARTLLSSIDTSHVVGLRDKSIICVMIYTGCRRSAVAKLRCQDFYDGGDQHYFRFEEKGGKSRAIPVRHDLQMLIQEYLRSSGVLTDITPSAPLFRSAVGKTRQLTNQPITGNDVGRIVKRRMKDAELPKRLSSHSFRVTTITDLLSHGVPLEDVQLLAGHADPRTTRLYDRRKKEVTRNIVERISI